MKIEYFSSWKKQSVMVLRVLVGILFLVHGTMKFGLLGGPGVTGTTQFFASVGIPAASIIAPLVAILETVGGLFLVIGILAQWAALWFAFEMLITTVLNLAVFKSSYVGHWELDTVLFAASLVILSHSGKKR